MNLLRSLSRGAVAAALVFLALALLASVNAGQRLDRGQVQVIDIHMHIAEEGGFSPAALTVRAGRPVTLRVHADDVAHAVAIGPGLDVDLGVIPPGEMRTITLTFDRPGVYTYYCNLWCSPGHWRMHGVIDVVDDNGRIPPAQPDPVIAALIAEGVDIDSSHQPSHATDASLFDMATTSPPVDLAASEWIGDAARARNQAPLDVLAALQAEHPDRTATELAAVVAAVWVENSRSNPDVPAAGELYAKNCAACHGVNGRGDGSAAALAATPPAPFTASALADRRSDVLYAKIRRGGMGTGMPNFGTRVTPEETWALVDYIWLLAFGENSEVLPPSP